MFDDLPEELNQVMLDAPQELRRPHIIHFLAALSVTRHYLRTLFTESTNAQRTLLDYSRNQAGNMSWEYPARICQIADAILTLRKEPGFNEICRRLKSRDLRSAFFEAMAAVMLKAHGFAIHAREEAQVLGEDFDFAIEAPSVSANVEATALAGNSFSARSIQNALNRKRRQVPSDKPAIIICFVPGRWRLDVWSIQFELKKVAQSFLRGT